MFVSVGKGARGSEMEYKPLKLGVRKSQTFSSINKTKPNLKQAEPRWKSTEKNNDWVKFKS